MPARAPLLLLLLAACSSGGNKLPSDAGPQDWPAPSVPDTEVVEPGVRRDLVAVQGAPAPANPTTGGKGDAALDATLVHRYRIDATPAAQVRAVIVAMPGFLAGARTFDLLARALVRRGAQAGQPVEVWALDRRANALEDRKGFAAAAQASDPEIAQRYYFGADTIGGKKFAGFLDQSAVDYLSEWGLALHAADLRRVIQAVPQDQRKARVFLMGHSLGAFFAEAYAGFRFDDGTRGFDELAGLLLLDGALAATPIDQASYNNGVSLGGLPTPGLTEIRTLNRYSALPLLGVSSFARSEVLAQRAAASPAAVVADADRDTILALLLGLEHLPRVTNAAAFGFTFDRRYTGLSFIAATLGQASGGPVATYTNALFKVPLLHPADPAATYGWDDSAASGALTSLRELAKAYGGASGDFVEWYFPARLPLDLLAVGGASVPEQGWQAQAGLRVFDGAKDDAPVLAVAGGLESVATMAAIAGRLAPAVGAGRPNAGAPRTDPAGFAVVDATALAHVDVVTGSEGAADPVHAAVEQFVRANAAAGTFAPPTP